MENRIPFNYELYLTGKYRAVYRADSAVILTIHPVEDNCYEVFDTSNSWIITNEGLLKGFDGEDENDVLLELLVLPFNLPAALKGAKLVTRDGRDVRDFKPNPDHAGPKAYIAMVGDDLIYYNERGCVNRSCEPHPLDLFIKPE